MPIIWLLLLFLLVGQTFTATISAIPTDSQSDDVKSYRRMVVQLNMKRIEEHNSNPQATYKMKAYPAFIHLTQEEFRATYLNKVESF